MRTDVEGEDDRSPCPTSNRWRKRHELRRCCGGRSLRPPYDHPLRGRWSAKRGAAVQLAVAGSVVRLVVLTGWPRPRPGQTTP